MDENVYKLEEMDRMDEIEGKVMEIVKNSLAWMIITLLILSKM